jgi:hypothetical protein
MANAATGRSLADALDRNQNDLINREVLGASGGGAGGIGAYASGRLRASDHDGLKPASATTFSYDTQEASAFANVVATLPGTVMGGQMKFSGFVGYNRLTLDLKSNATAVLDPDQFGGAENDTVIVGGTALWSKDRTYALASIVGMWGRTTLIDSIDDCGPCTLHRYKFDTSGFMGTLTGGQVFPLAASGLNLDLRASLAYIQNIGDAFLNTFGNEQKYKFSVFTGTIGATLFTNITMANSAVLRPYLQGYVRQEFAYTNKFRAIEDPTDPTTFLGIFSSQQAHFYAGLDVGMTYTLDKTTFTGAVYTDGSADERTIGARLGVQWRFN